MFIKLTNFANDYLGDPLYLNVDWIVSVYPTIRDGGSQITTIYGGPLGSTWYVEEGLEQVLKKINETKTQNL